MRALNEADSDILHTIDPMYEDKQAFTCMMTRNKLPDESSDVRVRYDFLREQELNLGLFTALQMEDVLGFRTEISRFHLSLFILL